VIGIPLGARLKLLKAIAALGARAEGTSPSADVAPPRLPFDAAERRQVTVMFSDLVGWMALSAHMDPEDLHGVVAATTDAPARRSAASTDSSRNIWATACSSISATPQAHEDDAERAVRASLDLIAAVAALKTRAALQTRVGIVTGLVVVGDVVDAGGSQERGHYWRDTEPGGAAVRHRPA